MDDSIVSAHPKWWEWTILIAITVASSAFCVATAHAIGVTFDETTHIVLGLHRWHTGSHGPMMRFGTAPLPPDFDTLPLYLCELIRGIRLDPMRDMAMLLPWARAMTLIFWWLLLCYGWYIARELAGPWAGIIAAALLAVEPTMLAHASIATTDIPPTACLLAAAYQFRAGRELGAARRILAPAIWVAVALLCKTSALVFAPLSMVAIELLRKRAPGNRPNFAGFRSADFWRFVRDVWRIMLIAIGLAVLYCGSDWLPEPSFVKWAQGLPAGAFGDATRWFASHLTIFPNAGEGFVRQIRHNIAGHGHETGTYLLGQTRRAFWYYFPVALTIKLTVPLLLLPIVIASLSPRSLLNWPNAVAALLLVFSPFYRVQIGVRLVLPIVAFAIVGLGASCVDALRRTNRPAIRNALSVAIVAGIVANAITSLTVWPEAISYINLLWGGTSHGYLYLSDSNYDWGQGLPELARWHVSHPEAPLDVWYFGTDPSVLAPPFQFLPLPTTIAKANDLAPLVKGHYLAVSTTFLYGLGDAPTAELLRSMTPIGRTTTFFIYDFTKPS